MLVHILGFLCVILVIIMGIIIGYVANRKDERENWETGGKYLYEKSGWREEKK